MQPLTRPEPQRQPPLTELPALLSAAPHRMMFFAGASAVLVSMLWWTLSLAATRFNWTAFPQSPIAMGWAHATLTQYGMLPMFIFGFLLTVFPRWMDQPALPRSRYIPVFAGVFGGYLLSHVGLLGYPALLQAGLVTMLAGWALALLTLTGVLRRNGGADRHALSCLAALSFGLFGLALLLSHALGGPGTIVPASIRIGTFALLLPIYFTVCHRMLPFFSKMIVHGYTVVRPGWSLPLLWILLLARIGIDLSHRSELLWLADLPLCLFFLWHSIAWQPWRAMRPGLLAVLHLAFAWLPIAFGMLAAQSLGEYAGVDLGLGRAPLHALTIGFFGSMLVAMVTRVTHGHSGRALQMGAIPWFTFIAVQVIAMMRIGCEFASDKQMWMVITAASWVTAFLPWALRALWIYLRPRADGQPG